MWQTLYRIRVCLRVCFTRIYEDVGMTQNENQLSRNSRPWFAPLCLPPLIWWFWSSSLSIRHFCKCKTMHNSTLHQHEQTRWQAFILRMRISNASVPDKFQRNSMCCLYLLWNSKLWKLQSKIWLYGRTLLAHSLIFFSGKLLLIWYLWVLFC